MGCQQCVPIWEIFNLRISGLLPCFPEHNHVALVRRQGMKIGAADAS